MIPAPFVSEIGETKSDSLLDAPYESWRVPQCPFSIECSSALLDRIRREIDAGLNSPRGEHEIGGVLFGKHYPDRVRILDCRLLQCEYAMGPGFVLSERDKKLLAELIVSA